MSLQKLEKGMILEQFKGYPQEGAVLHIRDGVLDLLILYNSPTSKEIKDFQTGDIDYRVAYIEDVVYFLFKFGRQPFIECPYLSTMEPTETLQPLEDETKGYGCLIRLVDVRTGRLEVLRFISFSHQVSKKLKELLDKQADTSANFGNIARAQGMYTTDEIVNRYVSKGIIKR